MDAALRINELTKYYGPVIGVEALSLDVPAGSVFGFLGANGAGKTTTIRLLLDLLRPTSGSASILGFDCRRESLEVRRRVGYLPSEMPFYADQTGAGYLKFLSALGGQTVSNARWSGRPACRPASYAGGRSRLSPGWSSRR